MTPSPASTFCLVLTWVSFVVICFYIYEFVCDFSLAALWKQNLLFIARVASTVAVQSSKVMCGKRDASFHYRIISNLSCVSPQMVGTPKKAARLFFWATLVLHMGILRLSGWQLDANLVVQVPCPGYIPVCPFAAPVISLQFVHLRTTSYFCLPQTDRQTGR